VPEENQALSSNIIERVDPEVWSAIAGERRRQQTGLEMIASEN
jgi:glycine/serine hydroxymethyltransferase